MMFKIKLRNIGKDIADHIVRDRPFVERPHQPIYIVPVFDVLHS